MKHSCGDDKNKYSYTSSVPLFDHETTSTKIEPMSRGEPFKNIFLEEKEPRMFF